MTDFEERLMSSLRSAGNGAPDAGGLAPAARARARSRRQGTALATAVGVVAIGAVVGGIAFLGRGGDGSPSVAEDVSTPAPTTRVETWHDVSVTVPSSWAYGPLSTWCIQGPEPGTPVVERPGGVVESIACTPANGYGVRFSEVPDAGIEAFGPGTVHASVGDDFPEGSWQGWDAVGGSRVLVVTPTQEEAERVLGSFEQVTRVDANGCAPQATDQVPVVADAQPRLRVCRYDADGRLEQSEVLVGEQAAAAIAALDDAPAKGDRMCTAIAAPFVLVSGMEKEGRIALDSCQGLNWAGADHDLTGDVLHWVLSPGWSGQVPEGITFQPRR